MYLVVSGIIFDEMVDSDRMPDTAPPMAVRGYEIAQIRGWVSNDVEPPPPATIPFPVALVLRAREDEEPVSEGPRSLSSRHLEPVLAAIREKQ